jgi:hypothetical protein
VSETLYKVLNANGRACKGGKGQWALPHNGKPGAWMPAIADLKPCETGYHLCRERDLVFWLGPRIFEAEARGARVECEDKVVVAEARLLRETAWNEQAARLFAADCAHACAHYFTAVYPDDRRPWLAIVAARKLAFGLLGEAAYSAAYWAAYWATDSAAPSAAYWAAHSAAHSAVHSLTYWAADRAAYWAAHSAMGSAAHSAARSAAHSAARSAAYSAVHSAARSAAPSAAPSAAYWAARSAAYSKLTARLMQYLRGEVDIEAIRKSLEQETG